MADRPVSVVTADGKSYTIPAPGPVFSATWWRYASLVAIAYRDVGDQANADKWRREAQRRHDIWDAVQAGKDRLEVLKQFGSDFLLAPVRIAAEVGEKAKRFLGLSAVAVVAIVIGLLVVTGVGFRSGGLKVRL